jgi:hypothetical protein
MMQISISEEEYLLPVATEVRLHFFQPRTHGLLAVSEGEIGVE